MTRVGYYGHWRLKCLAQCIRGLVLVSLSPGLIGSNHYSPLAEGISALIKSTPATTSG